MFLGRISAEMLTEELARRGYELRQIKEILVERGYQPHEWSFLCFLAVEDLYNQNFPPVEIRKFLIETEELPIKANEGGVDYWLIQAIIAEKNQKKWSLKRIAEFLKYLEFDCRTAALALEKVFPERIYLWAPELDLMVINNGDEQTSDIIDWTEV